MLNKTKVTSYPYETIIPAIIKAFDIPELACVPKISDGMELPEDSFSLNYADVVYPNFISNMEIFTSEVNNYKTLDYIEVTTPLGDKYILKSAQKYMLKDQESILNVVDLMIELKDFETFSGLDLLREGEYNPARFLMAILGVPDTAKILNVPVCTNREVKINFTLEKDEPGMEGYIYTLYAGINDKKHFQFCVMGIGEDGDWVTFPDHSFYN